MNLVSNSLKFTERGGIEIRASYVDNKYLKFEVEDSGRGISELE